MHDIVTDNIEVIRAFDAEFKYLGNEARKIRAEAPAIYIASRSTEAQIKRLVGRLPHAHGVWWRARFEGKSLVDRRIYRTGRRNTRLSLRDIDKLVGRDRSHLVELDRLTARKL